MNLRLLLPALVSLGCLIPATASASTAVAPAAAHEPGQSYVYLRVHDDSLAIRLEITESDLEKALGFGWDVETGVSAEEIEARLDSIRQYVESNFSIGAGGVAFDPEYLGWSELTTGGGTFVQLEYLVQDIGGIPDQLEVSYSVLFEQDRTRRNFLIIEHNWKTATFNNEAGISLIFTPRNRTQSLDLSSSSIWRGFAGLVWLGVLHIWIGIDHILFLLALILPAVLVRAAGQWKPVGDFRTALFNILAVVTAFTLAHSVTLALAGLQIVTLPSVLVESVIAASIAIAAAANLSARLDVREWLVAFGFGLFHGFGFASVMGDVGVGRDHLALSVFGFNVGVELGQIAIILVVFPVLYLVRTTRVYVPMMRFGSVALIALAMVWFGERAFGWDIYMTQIALDLLSRLPGVG
ncbi:MAG: HupE/UreJ family protein [Gemmatimonadota bacterium]|jgi:hypothetical protein